MDTSDEGLRTTLDLDTCFLHISLGCMLRSHLAKRAAETSAASKPLENVWEEHCYIGSLARVTVITGKTSLVTVRISTEKSSLATLKNAHWDWLVALRSTSKLQAQSVEIFAASRSRIWPNYSTKLHQITGVSKSFSSPTRWCTPDACCIFLALQNAKESLTSSITQPFFAWFPPFGPHPKCAVKECPTKK